MTAPVAAIVAVVGPTASGKSELGVGLAQAVGGEVVNVDSMQLYRGMDVGTAKLSPEQRRGVPHHLLDVWDVTQRASVAEFQRYARDTVDVLRERGCTPVLVGGSGLYVRAALDDLEFPGTDAELRDALERELTEHGPAPLYERLREADPVAAQAILPSNGRRIVRALEVVLLTGEPFAASLPAPRYVVEDTRQIGLSVSRRELDDRIGKRVERMWQAGFVDEVRRLEAAGLRRGRTASRALGYAQVLRFLAGEGTEEDAKAETIRASRRFARRQDAWFRRDPRVWWLAHDRPDLLDAALAVVRGAVRS